LNSKTTYLYRAGQSVGPQTCRNFKPKQYSPSAASLGFAGLSDQKCFPLRHFVIQADLCFRLNLKLQPCWAGTAVDISQCVCVLAALLLLMGRGASCSLLPCERLRRPRPRRVSRTIREWGDLATRTHGGNGLPSRRLPFHSTQRKESVYAFVISWLRARLSCLALLLG
jgi:hypothetical protein